MEGKNSTIAELSHKIEQGAVQDGPSNPGPEIVQAKDDRIRELEENEAKLNKSIDTLRNVIDALKARSG